MTMDTNKKLAVFIASAIVLAVLPLIVGNVLGNSWVRTIDFALLYVMLALGLNIVVGFAGLLDLGFIAFYAVGAYTFALLGSPHFGIHLPFYISIPLGALFAAMFGLLLGTPVLSLVGAVAAALTVVLRRGGVLIPLITLPLIVPVIVFATGAVQAASSGLPVAGYLALLAAFLVLALTLIPFAVAAALRIAVGG